MNLKEAISKLRETSSDKDFILPIKNMALFNRLLEEDMIYEVRPGVWDLRRRECEG